MNEGTNERTISSLSYRFPTPSFLLAEHHWATSLLNRLFTEQPPWDTSSLSCLLSGLLLWPASALTSLSYFSGLTSATQFFLWRNHYKALAGRVAASRTLSGPQPCQCVSSPPVAIPQDTDAATNGRHFGPEIAGAQIRHWSRHVKFSHFEQVELSLESPPHFSDLIFQKWSLPFSSFNIFSWNWALTTVSCAFCWQLCQICGNTDPPLASHHAESYL